MMFSIETISGNYRKFVDAQIAESWSGPFIAVHGALYDTRTHPGYAAVENGTVIGYILYLITNQECEITVLESLRKRAGVGGALINAVIQKAKSADCRRVWLITTNDNTLAIRFYQRFGFELKAVHINAMEQSRRLKPQIPMVGADGIPIKHEFEFEIINTYPHIEFHPQSST